jgi:hypothetical protein
MMQRTPWTLERLLSKLDTSGGQDACWPWMGARHRRGYGLVGARKAHRLIYRLLTSVPLDGICVCHRCDNPPCCNPAHLFAGTTSDNMRDMTIKGRNRPRGRAPAGVPLDATDAAMIREACSRQARQVDVAALYGVSQPLVSKIVRGLTWAEGGR